MATDRDFNPTSRGPFSTVRLGYKDGSSAFGCWNWRTAGSTGSWENVSDAREDFGAVVFATNGSGQHVQNVVGALGYTFGGATINDFSDIAYPAVSPFNGNRQEVCNGGYATSWNSQWPDTSLTPMLSIGCNFTGGSSGGPWIGSFSGTAGTNNQILSINRRLVGNFPNTIFGPYQDSGQALALYNFASNL
jgi:hypothetical protein